MKRKRESTSFDVSPYARPPSTLTPSTELIFSILECEDPKDKLQDSLIRIHGVTEAGDSLILLVRDFRQSLYYPITQAFTADDYVAFEAGLRQNLKQPVAALSFELCTREPLDYFRKDAQKYTRFLKIILERPSDASQIAIILGKADELPGLLNLFQQGKLYSAQVYETGVSFDLRFMCDLGLTGCGWVKIPAGKYSLLEPTVPYERASLTAEASYRDIEALSPSPSKHDEAKTAAWSKLPPLRCLLCSCLVLPNGTSNKSAPVTPTKKKTKLILTYGKDALDVGLLESTKSAQVHILESETAMIAAFRELFLAYDPDVLSGYDVTADAIPAILQRGVDLGLKDVVHLSRLSHVSLKTKRRQLYSGAWLKKERKMSAVSNREHTELGCTGRLVLDLRSVIEREERLRTYSLNEASSVLAGRTLEKLSTTTLARLWRDDSDADEQCRVLGYALLEGEAALCLLRTQASLITYVELARVTGLNFVDVVEKGQMKRFWSCLHRFCKELDVVVPERNRSGDQMTQSALNWMPEVAYDTQHPVAVLDFRSLYPSILIARNLCFSTEVMPGAPAAASGLTQDDTWVGFGGATFVNAETKRGIVPRILEHFLAERGRVKKLMAQSTTDATLHRVLDGRQKAIKVVANAVYGAMGARDAKVQNLAIADATISEGARLLAHAKEEIEKRYAARQVRVVYGDTDSVFLQVPGATVDEAIQLGKQISEEVSQIWPEPIQLEFEKVLFPSLLQNRKRYAGLIWTKPDEPDGVDVKGIEVNRRDAVPLLDTILGDIFKLLFPAKNNAHDQKITAADRQSIVTQVKQSVSAVVSQILDGKLDVSQFVMTKGLWLGTDASDYSGKQAHISVIEKMRARQPSRIFRDGERIRYCFVQGAPKAPGYEKAEDPVYVMEKGLLLDYAYYLAHTVHNPVLRILELMMPVKEAESLLKGAGSTTKQKVAVKGTGVMGAFLKAGKKQLAKCAICGQDCPPSRKLCTTHAKDALGIIATKKEEALAVATTRDDLLKICRACQESEREVLCVNLDCQIYFGRVKAGEQASALKEAVVHLAEAEQVDLSW
ncbi:DNA polymerase family B-domain-containing protein [Protomyces lactucae-debilis]|uniref:DNA polymerase n=1 Tax=Protomyces lactucae-debilis TaxID=2754530 RepID=A0A1Y2FK70_PROLT|nr:DNA polymerase family B-domain-containing protein [Protomyces lactucae-debilis]ORY83185.1 DNA polymerase family B-domain-containing protein [Protomyces lactucae-debilis]